VTGVARWSVVVGAFVVCAAAGNAPGQEVASIENPPAASPPVANELAAPVIEIWKAERKLELRQGDTVVGDFRVALGRDPRFGKEYQGDSRTPVGRYYIADKNPDSRFHRFLGISYPNVEDAERGYQHKLIDASQWADIFFANLRGYAPPYHTSLGGRVGIHGYGGRPFVPVDWTEGCIAVSDDDIEFIYDHVPVGTAVIINE